MKQLSTVLLAASALTLVAAQDADGTGSASADPFPIDASKVDDVTKSSWCTAESNNCGILCGGNQLTKTNLCDYKTLAYTCTCNNGTAPGLEYYKDTMPFYICTQAFQDCIKINENNNAGQMNCTNTILPKCGKLDVSTAQTGTGSGSGSASSTTSGGASKATGATTSAAVSTPTGDNKTGAAPMVAAVLGNVAVAVGAGLFIALL